MRRKDPKEDETDQDGRIAELQEQIQKLERENERLKADKRPEITFASLSGVVSSRMRRRGEGSA